MTQLLAKLSLTTTSGVKIQMAQIFLTDFRLKHTSALEKSSVLMEIRKKLKCILCKQISKTMSRCTTEDSSVPIKKT